MYKFYISKYLKLILKSRSGKRWVINLSQNQRMVNIKLLLNVRKLFVQSVSSCILYVHVKFLHPYGRITGTIYEITNRISADVSHLFLINVTHRTTNITLFH
jgi:hypothetical protein